jgi:hypothetical protein
MLYLAARVKIDCDTHVNSPGGVAALQQVLESPGSSPPLAAAQTEWLSDHANEAFHLLVGMPILDNRIKPWVIYQLRGLQEAGTLRVGAADVVDQYELLSTALGDKEFPKVLDPLLSDPVERTELKSSANPMLADRALILSYKSKDLESARPDIVEWAGSILKTAGQPEWGTSLEVANGGPLVALATDLLSNAEAPSLGGDFTDALRDHAGRLIGGSAAWEPSGGEFRKFASMVNAASQNQLASTICANLEGLDGNIAINFFNVYGEFLTAQSQFRQHAKLPNVIERLVAKGRWDAVEWFVAAAKKHHDMVDPKERRDAFDVLAERIEEKMSGVDSPPSPLVALKDLVGPPPVQDEK